MSHSTHVGFSWPLAPVTRTPSVPSAKSVSVVPEWRPLAVEYPAARVDLESPLVGVGIMGAGNDAIAVSPGLRRARSLGQSPRVPSVAVGVGKLSRLAIVCKLSRTFPVRPALPP